MFNVIRDADGFRNLHEANKVYILYTGCLKLIYKLVYGSDRSSYKLMSESMKAVHYCILLYMDGKGIGWATIERNVITMRLRIWLKPRCKDKRAEKKSERPIFAV